MDILPQIILVLEVIWQSQASQGEQMLVNPGPCLMILFNLWVFCFSFWRIKRSFINLKYRLSKHSKLSFQRCPVALRRTDMANWLIQKSSSYKQNKWRKWPLPVLVTLSSTTFNSSRIFKLAQCVHVGQESYTWQGLQIQQQRWMHHLRV